MNVSNSNQFLKFIGAESFNNYGAPVAECKNYSKQNILNTKTPFYPLNDPNESDDIANF